MRILNGFATLGIICQFVWFSQGTEMSQKLGLNAPVKVKKAGKYKGRLGIIVGQARSNYDVRVLLADGTCEDAVFSNRVLDKPTKLSRVRQKCLSWMR